MFEYKLISIQLLFFQVNITSLMGSEQQAKDLLGLIDDSVEKLAVLDKRLTNYDEYLQVSPEIRH